MNKEAKNKITVKIKLPEEKAEPIKVKISSDATFKEFLGAAIKENPKLKDLGCVKFEHRCNIWDTKEDWVKKQKQLKQEQTLVFNKKTLAEQVATHTFNGNTVKENEVKMGISSHLFIKDGAELSLVLASDDPCAINLNNLNDTAIVFAGIKSKPCYITENESIGGLQADADNKDNPLTKINWPRIIVGGITLLLVASTVILFLLFFLSSLNISLTAPIVSAIVSFGVFVFWAAWNKIVPKNLEGGIINTPLSENNDDLGFMAGRVLDKS